MRQLLTTELQSQQTALQITNDVSENKTLCYAEYEKPIKEHPLEVVTKYMETYSSSNAVAQDPEERVQLLQYTKLIKLKKENTKKKAS